MKHSLKTCLGLLAASLMIASTAWASDLRPWGAVNDYVEFETVATANQHPVTFSTEQLTTLLGHFYKRVDKKEPAPYFTQEEINRIAPDLVRLFAKAKPGEDIDFGTSFSATGYFIIPRTLNAGRLFVDNGQLNLLIGMCDAAQDIPYQQAFGKYRDLNHGSRIKPVDRLGCELLAGNDAERVNDRTDWLRLNIKAALTTKVVPTVPASSSTLTFGATPSPVKMISTAQPETASASSTAAIPSASGAEERLVSLKHLHDKGLITDTEYEQKRAAIIKGL